MSRLHWHNQAIFSSALFCLLSGCTAAIEVKHGPAGVASHVFARPAQLLHDSIPLLFSSPNLRQEASPALRRLFAHCVAESGPDTLRSQVHFLAETADSALFGQDYFTQATRHNIYLHSFGDYWQSATYYAAGKPLDYSAEFAIRLDSLGPHQTQVTIETLHPHVWHGYGGLGGMCGLMLLRKQKPVPTSKPEEQALLAFLLANLSTRR